MGRFILNKGRKVMRNVKLAIASIVIATTPLAAQFSSDFPGVPRAGLSIRGGKQNRTEWTLGGSKIPGISGGGDTLAFGIRLGFGRSYRIGNQLEWGFDYSFLDGALVKPPKSTDARGVATQHLYARGLVAYGIRLGAKLRGYSHLDPAGYGYSA